MIVAGLVSAIIPVHNRADMALNAVRSVLQQDYRPIEVVVVDDGSTDDTSRALGILQRKNSKEVRVLTCARPGGPGVAREAGRQVACGEFIQYLDSDDWLLPRKFRVQVAALEARVELAMVYGDVQELDESDATSVPSTRKLPSLEHGLPALLTQRVWHTFAPLYRRVVLDAAGPWLPLWNEEDWEYDARIAALGLPILHIPGPVGVMRRHCSGHLSGTARHRVRTLHHQSMARDRIVGHALRAGVDRDAPEMQSAVRSLFLLSRQCGAVGLEEDARRLFLLARHLSSAPDARDWRVYSALARWFGWRAAGLAATWRDRLRGAVA